MAPSSSSSPSSSGGPLSFVQRNKKTLVKLDFFKYEGHPRPLGGPQRSMCGVFGTFLLVLCLGGYMSNSFYRFMTTPPSVSVTLSPTFGHIDFVPMCINVPNLTDPRYFAYQIQRVDTNENMTTTRHTLHFTVVSRDEICINATSAPGLTLRRFCSPGDCSILKFKLWNCNNSDDNLPVEKRRPTSECAPQADIEQILELNYVQIRYQTDAGTALVNSAPKFSGSSVYSSVFALNESITNPDFLREFAPRVDFSLTTQDTSYTLQYFFVEKDPATGKVANVPYKEVLEVSMSLGPHKLLTTNTRSTSLDMISQWGAFANVLVLGFGLVFARFNERRFYEANPAWESIDGDFKVEKGRAAMDTEVTKLIQAQQQQQQQIGVASVGARAAAPHGSYDALV